MFTAHQSLLLLPQDTLEVFVESQERESAAPTKKLRKGLSKVFGRKDSDSDGEAESVEAASGVGDAEEALDGHLFSVGVAFAQVRVITGVTQTLWLVPSSEHQSQSHLHLQYISDKRNAPTIAV